jgi:ketosteroid isomerase-like protein
MSQENVETLRGVQHHVSLPSRRAGQRRTLDERLCVRFPALYHLIAHGVQRLPPGSRLRRLLLTRFAGRSFAAVNRRDFEVLFLALDPAIEYHPAGENLPPGMDAISHGHDGYEHVWREFIDSFEDFHAEPEEIIDLGDQLVGTIQYKGHGSGSGVPVNIPLFQLFRFRRGLVIWQKDFADRSEALDAAATWE